MTVERMKRPWNVVGAGFNDDGVYFTFDDTTIHRADVRLMEAAPDLLKELQKLRMYVINVCGVDDEDCDGEHPLMSSQAAISKALGEE
ncbi:hypothetical protein DP196_24030 [Enterobacter hormaechei subsp. steigerwaltii]|uniref:hypothetical protein n=1 Tax=Enterobacter hormaechei TaxID=158836 RepID=UPI000DCB2A03|nr:hypothetical protein [Enterobacter hormaechei]RAY86369.1 hypothetical protein DP196_24030 [Enterobacter hormaechei subsp. steigerwaltii]